MLKLLRKAEHEAPSKCERPSEGHFELKALLKRMRKLVRKAGHKAQKPEARRKPLQSAQRVQALRGASTPREARMRERV